MRFLVDYYALFWLFTFLHNVNHITAKKNLVFVFYFCPAVNLSIQVLPTFLSWFFGMALLMLDFLY